MYVVEYQKRGLTHAHILLVVDDDSRLRTPADVDSTICAELPPDPIVFASENQKEQADRLLKVVLKSMIRGPCGKVNPKSPCMINGRCSKGYPKAFADKTTWAQSSSYPNYRRRSEQGGGRSAIVGDYAIDNRWVVPYNPYLLLKYGAHINVEACVSPFAAKYLFLYINKLSCWFFWYMVSCA